MGVRREIWEGEGRYERKEGRWREDWEKMLVPRCLSLNTRLTHKVDLYRADNIGGCTTA